jgi:hypothetical protein
MELRYVHYATAIKNFGTRSLNGLLWPRSKGAWR